ncbi:MAG TPA: UBP-type zinc finger domain-containing protein [Actinomycetota bacterium]|nr:UBP-type zinc finger domain-containing protein [Actinomycetota bacterium]
MAVACNHVDDIRDDWPQLDHPVCEDCAKIGGSWVSLRRCLSCGHVGCCDSSPNKHATKHHRATDHPIVRALGHGQDWCWCYFDEISLRRHEDHWDEVDFFFEVGLGYMREHLQEGGGFDVDAGTMTARGFPLGEWAGEMRRRDQAGELTVEQRSELEKLPGWAR